MSKVETELYNVCKTKKEIEDFQLYFKTYPTDNHIEHIKGWYPHVLEGYLKSNSRSENIKNCRIQKRILDEFRKNDANNSNYWSSLIANVNQIEDAEHKQYVSELKEKKGKVKASEYAKLFDGDVLTDGDLAEIGLTREDMDVLKNTHSTITINIDPLEKSDYDKGMYRLPDKCTEIYLWGMPASGKSCCLSAFLSMASEDGYCGGYDTGITGNEYFELLTNVFKKNGKLSTLIQGTNTASIASASYTMHHPKYGTRKMCLIDLAGETFKSMHKVNNGKNLEDEDESLKLCLDVTTDYLTDTRNRKLHFFMIPYVKPGEEKLYDGFSISQYMQAGAAYLKNKGIITNSTDGIYIVVTKADLMDCDKSEYKKKAEEYVKSEYKAFYNSMEIICKNNGIGTSQKRLEVLPFSIGHMIAPELCKFNAAGAEELIDIVCAKSIKVSNKWWSILSKIFGL